MPARIHSRKQTKGPQRGLFHFNLSGEAMVNDTWPGKLADGTDDPDDWIAPASDDGFPDDWIPAAPQANSNPGSAPSGLQTSATGRGSINPPPVDPLTAYWSRIPTGQFGPLASTLSVFPSVPGSTFGPGNTAWPPAPQPVRPNIPSGGILESLRYLGRQPGQTPYAGILEGLRHFGAEPDLTSMGPTSGAWDSPATSGLLEVPDDGWLGPSLAAQSTPAAPTTVLDGRRPIGDYSTGEVVGDAAKSFGVGIGRGTLGLAGLGGDARELVARNLQKAADYLAPGYAPNIGAKTSEFLSSNPVVRALNPLLAGPSSSRLQNAVEQVTGPFYQPQTVAGDYAQTIGEFLPGAILVPEGSFVARALRYGFVPAVGSETAGQLTQGTVAEPWARLAGAVLGGGLSASRNFLPKQASPLEPAIPSAAEQLAARRRAQLATNQANGAAWESYGERNILPRNFTKFSHRSRSGLPVPRA